MDSRSVRFKRLDAVCYFLFAIRAGEQTFFSGRVGVITGPGSIPLSGESLELREEYWLEIGLYLSEHRGQYFR